MKGGPSKTEVGGPNTIWCYHGPLTMERLLVAELRGRSKETEAEIQKEIARWTQLLQDDSYDFHPDMKRSMQQLIDGLTFLEKLK